MMATNLSKFETIEKDMQRAVPLMIKYLDALEEYNDVRLEYRREHRKIKKELANISQLLDENNEKTAIKREFNTLFTERYEQFADYALNREGKNDIYRKTNSFAEKIKKLGYENESERLKQALSDMTKEKKKRPSTKRLLNVLKPVKSNRLDYFESGNYNSHSYSLNVAYSDAIAYARRAILEERGYQGTYNAFSDLIQAYDDLANYMYDRFYQIGGTPYNYHGHENR